MQKLGWFGGLWVTNVIRNKEEVQIDKIQANIYYLVKNCDKWSIRS